jgi:hypothetical protein
MIGVMSTVVLQIEPSQFDPSISCGKLPMNLFIHIISVNFP